MRCLRRVVGVLTLLGLSLTLPALAASLPVFTSIYDFQSGATGLVPLWTVTSHNGALFGTTSLGGEGSAGTVYQLTPPLMAGGAWTYTTIYSFQGGSDGFYPVSGVTFDAAGNLYGTTKLGGSGCDINTITCGVVYELSPPSSSGGSWTETVLYAFRGGQNGDGASPEGGVAVDALGNVYGTAPTGQPSGGCQLRCGIVFELSPPSSLGGPWTETILHHFTGGLDGEKPLGNVLLGKDGSLYGSAGEGGANQHGTIFQLRPSGSGGWIFKVIDSFGLAVDGSDPGDLQLQGGVLYGTTASGNSQASGSGIVFKLQSSPGGTWTETVLLAFSSNDPTGFQPFGALAIDRQGNIFGTTAYGGLNNGNYDWGTIYELSPNGNAWTETILHIFQSSDGGYPVGVAWSGGVLYGATEVGGAYGNGTVFSIVP